jgi:hypothetical protein
MTAEKILENWNKLMKIIEDNFSGTLKDNILKLHDHFEERIIEAPASGRPEYHNCFPGGYLDHVLRIIETGLDVKQQFINMGVEVTCSDSDIILAAMFHDLGKVGDLNTPYYIVQTDEWRRNKLNEYYTYSKELENLSVTDRALWLLQYFDIKVSQEVWKAIKLADGMFDEGNTKLFRLGTNNQNILHYIIHFADWMATVAEKQHYVQTKDSNTTVNTIKNKKTKVRPKTDTNLDDLKNEFDKLFA